LSSLGMGLNIAASALMAQQDSLDVTSNNIANASTTGYSKETAEVVTSPPMPTPSLNPSTPGQFGTGVDVQTVTRARDQFLDTQYRLQNEQLGQAQQQSTALSQVQTIFGNLSSTTGLSTDLNNFWQAWNTLSQDPQDMPQRTTLLGTATTLTDNIQGTYSQLTSLQENLNSQIGADVSHVNDDLNQIASLNVQIQAATNSGLTPNTLLDQRDNLLDDLSTYVNVQAATNSDNTVTLSIGGATVLEGPSAAQLTTIPGSPNQVGIELGSKSLPLQGAEVGGAIYGLQQAWTSVQGYIGSLNSLATTVANAVNAQHEQGYGLDGSTGLAFFTSDDPSPIDASNIEVNPALENNPEQIAAALGTIQSTATTAGVAPSPGTQQAMTLNINGSATADGNLTVQVTAANMAGSPFPVSVPVTAGESANDIGTAIASALNGAVGNGGNGFFTVLSNGSNIVLTANAAANNDDTMNVSVTGGEIPDTQSAPTTAGVAPAAGTQQAMTLTINNGAAEAKTLQVTVKAAGMTNSPKTIPVDVPAGDDASQIATLIAGDLSSDPDVSGFFQVNNPSAGVVTLKAINAAANDDTMNVSVSDIMSGASPSPGDGSNALNIFDLSYANLSFGTVSDTAGNFYDSMISGLGAQASQVNNEVTNQTSLTTQLNNSRQSVSGVSLDEEMTNMVEEQNAYEAAAKLVSTIAEMMQTVVNMVPTI